MIRRFVVRSALTKGLVGGSRFWTVVGTLGIAMRVLKKVVRDEPEVVYSEELGPGQSIVISHDGTARVVRRRR